MDKSECHGPFSLAHPLVLASASPRRKDLLSSLCLEFEVIPCVDEEPDPDPGELPYEYARRVSALKAKKVSRKRPKAVTLAADTIVVIDGQILGKPQGINDAVSMLTRLSGRWHTVYTAGMILWPQRRIEESFLQESKVHILSQPQEVLRAYAGTGEPLDKAGSYAIQGIGAFMVDEIRGSYTNVVGLPLEKVVSILLRIGALRIRHDIQRT